MPSGNVQVKEQTAVGSEGDFDGIVSSAKDLVPLAYREKTFDIVVSDVRMDDADGLEVLEAVQKSSSRTQTILITGYATVELAREALAKGAYDFLAKPFQPKDLRAMIEKAARKLEKKKQ